MPATAHQLAKSPAAVPAVFATSGLITHPTTPAERIFRRPLLAAEIKAARLALGKSCTDEEASVGAGFYLEYGRNDPVSFGLGFGCGLRDESLRIGALMAVRAWVAAQMAVA